MNSNYPMNGVQNWYVPTSATQHQYDGYGNTNVYKVTSLEEAIMKSNMRPSETVYFHQTKNEFYNVRVDINGNKSWQTFSYNVPNIVENVSISKADFDALAARIAALENRLEVPSNVEPNG